MTLLPLPRTACDEDDGLVVRSPCPFDLVQDERVCELLLIQQDELFAPLDLLGGNRQQLLRGSHRGLDQLVGVRAAGYGGVESFAEEIGELRAACADEEASTLVLRVVEEILDGSLRHGVVQVRRAGKRVLLAVEKLGEVGEVVAVAADLGDWVESWSVRVSVDQDEFAVVLPGRCSTPLLQLDDHVRRSAGARVAAG
jgi:hypothetical protein